MHKLLEKSLAAAILSCALCVGEASASWIRVLFVEYADGSQRDMEAIQQSFGGPGPWTTTDPDLGDFFRAYTANYSVSRTAAHSISLAFDLYSIQSDPQSGPGQANIGRYNIFDPASGALTAALEVAQAQERVTVDYASALGGGMLSPLPNAVRIDGWPSQWPDWYLPICDNGCESGRFPLGFGVAVTRVPEPGTIALWSAVILGAFAARRRRHDPPASRYPRR